MNAPLSLRADAPPGMHPDEWAARQQLAACYRIFDHFGWSELIYNHITLRVPDEAPADAPAEPVTRDTVVATVNGTAITLGEVIIAAAQLPPRPASPTRYAPRA